jgi:uracil permease
MSNDYQTQSPVKTAVLSFQHMFAMFGATVLVPILSNMSVSVALLAAGIGTIIFYFLTSKKVPVFLGSSFAFLPALMSVMHGTTIGTDAWNTQMGKASVALILAGLVYVAISLIIKGVGVEKVKKLFPPIVVGPVIIVIGMVLAPKMFYNNIIGPSVWSGFELPLWKQWTAAGITALSIIAINAYAKPKSFLKIIPILLGFVIGYAYSLAIGLVDFSQADWSKIVIFQDMGSTFGFYGSLSFDWSVVLSIVPIAIVTFMEHLGDINANSAICGKDFMVDPGVHRTVLGDGVATMISGAMGGPANTTYGENTAVLAITRNYNPRNIFIAACLAVFFGCFTLFGTAIATIPAAVIGGASIVLFGMISASGLRTLVAGKVDFTRTKNLIVVSVILSIGLGLGAMSLAGDVTGESVYKIFLTINEGNIELSPLAIATVAGILLNLIIPEQKDSEE